MTPSGSQSGPGFAIENHLGSGWLLLRDRTVKVQRQFTATMEREPRTGLRLELEIEVDRAGNPHCRAVRLSSDPDSRTFDDSITTASWREVNLATLVDAAYRDALEPIREVESDDDEFTFEVDPTALPEIEVIAQGLQRTKARKPLGNDELRAIAKVYRAWAAEGRNPTKLLAERFNVSRSTARRWAQRAVERGFLAPDERLDPATGAKRPRADRN